MNRTMIIAIAALLYVLTVGHARHATVYDAPVSLGDTGTAHPVTHAHG
jgi:hypothetical protein